MAATGCIPFAVGIKVEQTLHFHGLTGAKFSFAHALYLEAYSTSFQILS